MRVSTYNILSKGENTMLLPINKEPRFKIKIKKGYTLHIDGKYYQEGEEIFVTESMVSDQAWKFDRLGVVEEGTVEAPDGVSYKDNEDADDLEAKRLEDEAEPKNKEESKRVRISQKNKEE
jgi:hypothetical protein